MKWAGLESSGQWLISTIGKIKRIAFFFGIKTIFKISDFLKKPFFEIFQDFSDFFLRIGLDWRALVNLRIPYIETWRGFFSFFFSSDFFWDHWHFLIYLTTLDILWFFRTFLDFWNFYEIIFFNFFFLNYYYYYYFFSHFWIFFGFFLKLLW